MALVMSVRLIRLPVADRSLLGVAVAVDDGKTLECRKHLADFVSSVAILTIFVPIVPICTIVIGVYVQDM